MPAPPRCPLCDDLGVLLDLPGDRFGGYCDCPAGLGVIAEAIRHGARPSRHPSTKNLRPPT